MLKQSSGSHSGAPRLSPKASITLSNAHNSETKSDVSDFSNLILQIELFTVPALISPSNKYNKQRSIYQSGPERAIPTTGVFDRTFWEYVYFAPQKSGGRAKAYDFSQTLLVKEMQRLQLNVSLHRKMRARAPSSPTLPPAEEATLECNGLCQAQLQYVSILCAD